MSMNSPGVPWSAQQREWLQALGHEVLMPVPAGAVATERGPGEGAADVAELPARRSMGTTGPTQQAPVGSTLLRALARAAGRSEHDAEFLGALPDVATLRDPAARRALWPRLRALRKRAKP